MKVVINSDYGGFGLSVTALERYVELGGVLPKYSSGHVNVYSIERNDPILVQVVEELGPAAGDKYATLRIVEIPDDATDWYISEYDGNEWVAEGRTWQ